MVSAASNYKKWLAKPAMQLAMPVVPLALFCGGAFLLYFPNLSRTFSSDDFQVIRRVSVDHEFVIKGFFRPLSDITLYFNYLIGGYRPRGYYAFNILLHGVSCYVFYLFCLRWRWTDLFDDGQQRRFAFVAAVLFLAYPFHSESVDWILGRGSTLAGIFGMGTLVAVVSKGSRVLRLGVGSACYFIGMAAYESAMLLPLMVLVILFGGGVERRDRSSRREGVGWMAVLGLTLLVHLGLRIMLSGGVTGGYADAFLGRGVGFYLMNVLRVVERMVLPPIDNAWLITKLVILVLLVIGAGLIRVALHGGSRAGRDRFLSVCLLFAVSCAVPLLAGVSTHTSESDRFLYFPSYFLCAGVALLIEGAPRRWIAWGVLLFLLGYEIINVGVISRNWNRASAITREVLEGVRWEQGGKMGGAGGRGVRGLGGERIFVVNLPDEVDGAFVFRLGFSDALLMMRIDTSGVVVVNHLRRDDEGGLPGRISIGWVGGEMRLAPSVIVRQAGAGSFRIVVNGKDTLAGVRGDVVMFWNREELESFQP